MVEAEEEEEEVRVRGASPAAQMRSRLKDGGQAVGGESNLHGEAGGGGDESMVLVEGKRTRARCEDQ